MGIEISHRDSDMKIFTSHSEKNQASSLVSRSLFSCLERRFCHLDAWDSIFFFVCWMHKRLQPSCIFAGLVAGLKPKCSCLCFRKSAGPDYISMLCCSCQIMNIMVDSWRVVILTHSSAAHPDVSVTFVTSD